MHLLLLKCHCGCGEEYSSGASLISCEAVESSPGYGPAELHFGCYNKAPRLNSSQKKGFVWAYRSRGMEGHGAGESADMPAGTGC